MSIEARLTELGVTLPEAPMPAANYVPYVVTGNLVHISGQISQNEAGMIKGKLGADMDVAAGAEAAEAGAGVCAAAGSAVGAFVAGPGVGAAGFAGPGRAPVDGRGAVVLAAGASAGFAAPSASRAARSLRATGGAMVDEGLLTYSPSSFSFARATLLSTPISEAISCTRGFATILLSGVHPGQGGPLRADGSHFEPFTLCP